MKHEKDGIRAGQILRLVLALGHHLSPFTFKDHDSIYARCVPFDTVAAPA